MSEKGRGFYDDFLLYQACSQFSLLQHVTSCCCNLMCTRMVQMSQTVSWICPLRAYIYQNNHICNSEFIGTSTLGHYTHIQTRAHSLATLPVCLSTTPTHVVEQVDCKSCAETSCELYTLTCQHPGAHTGNEAPSGPWCIIHPLASFCRPFKRLLSPADLRWRTGLNARCQVSYHIWLKSLSLCRCDVLAALTTQSLLTAQELWALIRIRLFARICIE